ncbi:L-aspartate oxidase [Spirochaetota bacterium]|nr:L-aspartate oxidase [Spirochaetota bacterium]
MKVVIIGMGVAGLTSAILSAEAGDETTLVVKTTDPYLSASAWAQGGIVYAGENDSPSQLMTDMQNVSGGMTRTETLHLLAHEGPPFIKDFLIKKIHVPFAKTNPPPHTPNTNHTPKNNDYLLTKEAGHQCNRILFSGDQTGEVIVKMLYEYLIEHTKITILWDHLALDLINIPHHSTDPMSVYEETHCVGVYVLDKKTNNVKKQFADKIILATGGIGQIYKQTTNPPTATGDGIAIAHRAGARIINMEFTQFHPTSLAVKKANSFLISEALRGEGATLLNEQGQDFISPIDKRGALTPRDKLSRLIIAEQQKNHEDHVYLSFKDCTFSLQERFPKIYQKCKSLGLDLERKQIPVTPAFHFSCGGILVDRSSQTSVKNLYAVGECACTGVHGANRLASTSLLEASYFAAQAVLHKPSELYSIAQTSISDWRIAKNPIAIDPVLLYQDLMTVQSIMWNYVGIIRKNHTLSRALKELFFLKERVDEYYRTSIPTQNIVELRNTVQTALLVTESAIKNTHSVGSHYLQD